MEASPCPLRCEGGATRRWRGLYDTMPDNHKQVSTMSTKSYNSALLKRARELRTNATKQENRLWYEFLRVFRPRFTRQRIVGNYILDFYCSKAKLAIELDGSQHFEPGAMKYDKTRTEFLNSLGIQVIRFTNTDLNKSFGEVCDAISMNVARCLDGQPPPSADGTPFVNEGGREKQN